MKKVMSYYQQELNRCLEKYKDIMLKLENKVIIVAGSSGMIGKCIIDILMQFNSSNEKKIKILALSKNKDFAYERFGEYINKEYFCYKQCDITKPLSDYGYVDYIIHCADDYNNGIKSFSCSIDGIRNMLLYGERYRTKKLCFVSTDEVYGECEIDRYKESDMGIFDCTQYRSIYIEGKRAAEAFLKHFCEYCELEYVICRIAKCFGPTIHKKNKKMIHQFLYRAAGNDVIELKSDGKQKFSFIHVIDAAIGVLISMLIGQAGEIYNISNEKNEFTVRELAERISLYTDFKGNIVQNIADGEKQNFSKNRQLLTSAKKLQMLGWKPENDLDKGIQECISVIQKDLDKNMEEVYEKVKKSIQITLDNRKLELPKIEHKFEKIPVWICWWQGEEEMPELVQCCLRSIRDNFPLDRTQIIMITEQNFTTYVSLSEKIIENYKKGIITKTHLSDILRAELLYRYGGWWLDATIFVTKKLPNYFLDRTNLYTIKRNTYAKGDISKGMYTGFIWYVPYKGSKLFSFVTKAFIDYWEVNNQLIEYYLINYIIAIAINNFQDICQEVELCQETIKGPTEALQVILNNRYNREKWMEYIQNMQFYKMQRRFALFEIYVKCKETFWGYMKKMYLY